MCVLNLWHLARTAGDTFVRSLSVRRCVSDFYSQKWTTFLRGHFVRNSKPEKKGRQGDNHRRLKRSLIYFICYYCLKVWEDNTALSKKKNITKIALQETITIDSLENGISQHSNRAGCGDAEVFTFGSGKKGEMEALYKS